MGRYTYKDMCIYIHPDSCSPQAIYVTLEKSAVMDITVECQLQVIETIKQQ